MTLFRNVITYGGAEAQQVSVQVDMGPFTEPVLGIVRLAEFTAAPDALHSANNASASFTLRYTALVVSIGSSYGT